MPHVILKMAAGKSKAEKQMLAQALADAVTSTLNCDEKLVSVAIEDIEVSDWKDKVFIPDILGKPELIWKEPGYDPLS